MALRAFDGLLEGVSSAGGIVLRQPRRMSGGGPLGRERGNSGVAGLFEDRRGVRRDDSGGQRRRDGQRRKQSFRRGAGVGVGEWEWVEGVAVRRSLPLRGSAM